jgi:Fe-S-cluster-containing hydrogenase component 2/bacterioferritin-associated ferredoxin
VESVTIGKLDPSWKTVPGTERTFKCDTVLVAVGLEPVDEFLKKAKEYGLPVVAAGDAEEIAEASAAMFTGRIRGLEIAKMLGRDVGEVPPEWHHTAQILKSRPGATVTEEIPDDEQGVFPVFHCSQEIPCNPCTSVCTRHSIRIEGDDILGLPTFVPESACDACEKCVAVCPGLAMTLVDFRPSPRSGSPDGSAAVTIPYEFAQTSIKVGDTVTVLDTLGAVLGNVKVERVRAPKFADRAALVKVRAPADIAKRIAGIRVQDPFVTAPMEQWSTRVADDEIVCRCERVTAGQLRGLIRSGVRDLNQLKAATRCGMGACGGKTCPSLIKRVFREEGVSPAAMTDLTARPIFMEVPLGAFAGVAHEEPAPAEAPKAKPGAFQGGL